jgi:hypothetical protein
MFLKTGMMDNVHNSSQRHWKYCQQGRDLHGPSTPVSDMISFALLQFIYSSSLICDSVPLPRARKTPWLKQPLSYGERQYFNLVSRAQSVETELSEMGGRRWKV